MRAYKVPGTKGCYRFTLFYDAVNQEQADKIERELTKATKKVIDKYS